MKSFGVDAIGIIETKTGWNMCGLFFGDKDYVWRNWSHTYNRANFGFMGSL